MSVTVQTFTFRVVDKATGKIVRKPLKITLTIDEGEIMRQLGGKAYANKSGRTRALHGAVIVESTNG